MHTLGGGLINPSPQVQHDDLPAFADPACGIVVRGALTEAPVRKSQAEAVSIGIVDSMAEARAVEALVQRKYATRGYRCSAELSPRAEHELTLIANHKDGAVGTLTIGFDNPAGLKIDDIFRAEADALRAAGSRICEFTRLAMESVERSTAVLASLFEAAYTYAHRVMGFDKLLIEVHPRHLRYYQGMYGFAILGDIRLNRRVEAPAVLLCLDLAAINSRCAAAACGGEPRQGSRALTRYHREPIDHAPWLGRLQVSTTPLGHA